MNKTLGIILAVIGILIIGFFVFNSSVDEGENQIPDVGNGESTLEIKIGESKSALGVIITPREILEDSRCPINAQCIWAGTVKIRATLESGLGTADQVFELNQPITTEGEEVTLVNVSPIANSTITIEDSEYVFHFRITKR